MLKVSWLNTLKGENPKGASGRRPYNSRRRRGTFERVKAWKSGPIVPVRRIRPSGDLDRLTACGFCGRGNLSATFQKGNASKGRIPGTLSGRNKPGQAKRGVNRPEGNQTLKAERSGCGKPAVSGPESLVSVEGTRKPRRGAAMWLIKPVRPGDRRSRQGWLAKNSGGTAEVERVQAAS